MFTADFMYLGAGLVLGYVACQKGVLGKAETKAPPLLLDAVRKEMEPHRNQQELLSLLKEFLEKQGVKP